MKILWLCNIILPEVARELNLPHSSREGWLTGYFDQFMADGSMDVSLCFPYGDRETMEALKRWMNDGRAMQVAKFNIGKSNCYAFRENLDAPDKYDENLEDQLKYIVDDLKPDIVHIFGSEFPHALAMAKVFAQPSRTLLSIQGLCGKIAEAYTTGIPANVIADETFRDVVKQDGMVKQQEKFARRAEHERALFALIGHVTGRTKFDKETTAQLNPSISYHHLNESLRESFYQGRWSRAKSEPYSIFLSQGDYPVKGFHYMLEAMPQILRDYPEAQLYVAGNNIIGPIENAAMIKKIKSQVKLPAYGKHLKNLLFEHQLEDKVTMLGKLDEQAMKEQFLKSAVFVCPSTVENSPNALCEAMLLGVPVVAAAVGGIPCFISDGKDGLLYEPGNIGDLAAAIKIAWDRETGPEISAAAIKRASKTHNRILNYLRLLGIYKGIMA